MTYFAKIILISSAAALAMGCSSADGKSEVDLSSEAAPSPKTSSAQGYSKPSAAIDFSHDFQGRSTVGAVETVNFKLTDRYPGASVDFDIVPGDGVQIFGNNLNNTTMKLDGETPHDLSLQFQASREGVHQITIVAKVTTADGQFITRSYSMPVYVGDDFQPTKNSIKSPETTSIDDVKVSDGLVIMEAEETIED